MSVAGGGPRLTDPHFSETCVTVTEEPLRLTDGRTVGVLVVARTPRGTATRWAGKRGLEEARLEALGAALSGDLDTVDVERVLVRHDEDNNKRGGTVRAVAPHGCKTQWVGEELEVRAWCVLKSVLRGEVSCPWCGHDYLTKTDGEWGCPECERDEVAP